MKNYLIQQGPGIASKAFNYAKKLITGGNKQKTTGTEVISKVTPNVPETKSDKVKRDLKLATQKSKASQAKLDNTIFRIEQQKKRLKDMQTEKRNEGSKKLFEASKGRKFNKGGRVGLKFGSKRKSNVQKIQETFRPKKQLSAKQMKIAKLAGNPKKIDAADFAKLRKS